MQEFEFDIQGLDAVHTKLKNITHDLQRKSGRAALRKAANLLARAARSNAKRLDDPATAEVIAKNVAVRWSPRDFRRTGNLRFRVGVRGGARQYAKTRENVRKLRVGQTYKTLGDKSNPGGDTWYWRLVEFGTNRSRAQPFLRPAAEKGEEAVDLFVREYGKALDKVTDK